MAADRVARGRAGADAVLAVDPARGDRLRRSGRLGSAALAHRAGLPGSQAGSRARALRGPRLARLPPSRHAVHRGLWLSDRRAGEIFPPQAQVAPGVSKRLAFPRVTTPRRRRSDPNGTCRTRSPPCDDGSPWRWTGACIDARAAHAQIRAITADPSSIAACDAVVLLRELASQPAPEQRDQKETKAEELAPPAGSSQPIGEI